MPVPETTHLTAFNRAEALISKIVKLTLKISVSIGVILIIYYCNLIGYYPVEISIGDGLIFLTIATIFGLWIIFINIILLFSSLSISWLFITIYNLYKTNKDEENKKLPNVSLASFALSIFMISLFLALALMIKINLVALIASLLFMAVLCVIYKCSSKIKHRKLKRILFRPKNVIELLQTYAIFLAFILAPLFTLLFHGGLFKPLIEFTLELASFRKEAVYIELDNDYLKFAEEITSEKISKDDKVTLLFRGVGSTSAIRIKDKTFIIPNNKYKLAFN